MPPAGQAPQRVADPAVLGRQPTRPPSRRWPRCRCCSTAAGLGQIQDITKAFSTAFTGREQDLRSLIEQLDKFVGYLNDQKDDIIAATDSLNNLVGQFADQKPVIDKALKTIPDALTVLKDERENLADALDELGKFSALAADSVNQTKENLVKELKDLGPVLESLANAGPALTRSLSFFATFPFPKETLSKWMRGDYANLTAVIDLTLSRLDAGLFTGTRWEGNLTELEMQWGRTIGQMPSPCMAGSQYTPATRWSCPTTSTRGRDIVLTRRIKIQLAVFATVSLIAGAIMIFAYMQVPAVLFGVGHYTVTVELPQAGGLYPGGNVTYRGTEVGRVQAVRLTDTGVEAVLSAGVRCPHPLRSRTPRCTACRRSASNTSSCCRAAQKGRR